MWNILRKILGEFGCKIVFMNVIKIEAENPLDLFMTNSFKVYQ